MVNNAVIWFEIMVQDMARAKAFYESVFQVKLERLNTSGFEMWSFPMEMDRVGIGGALVKMDGAASGGNSGTRVLLFLHGLCCRGGFCCSIWRNGLSRKDVHR